MRGNKLEVFKGEKMIGLRRSVKYLSAEENWLDNGNPQASRSISSLESMEVFLV